MTLGTLRTLTVKGDGFHRGQSHGEAFRDEIRAYSADRLELACSGAWSATPLAKAEVLEIADGCVAAHQDYSADLTEELRGLAAATGLSTAEILIVGGFTDFVDTLAAVTARPGFVEDDCSAVLIPDAMADGGHGFLAQTWDMHDSATKHVILLQVEPDDGPRATVFTTTGCVGQMGVNDAGIAVGINNLSGADGRIGVTWTHVVRQVLTRDNYDDALAAITNAPLAGAHNYSLLAADGRGATIEAYPSVCHITELGSEPLGHTNHALWPDTLAVSQPREPALQAHSEARLAAVTQPGSGPIGAAELKQLLSEPTICYSSWSNYHVETCGAAIMQPATGEMWACWGQPSENPWVAASLADAPA